MKKINTQEFINKAIHRYGDKYQYESTIYTKMANSVTVVCKIHNTFSVRAGDFLSGKSACQKCSGKERITQEYFIQKAEKVHNGIYNYDKVQYINKSTDVIIICYKHGEFKQTPYAHLIKNGCFKCGIEKSACKRKKTKEQFIEKAIKVHGNLYNYDKVEYINSKTKVIITCRIHGDFEQKPNSHTTSHQGCLECGGSKIKNTNLFIENANRVHKNLYDYSKSNYINGKQKVIITCKTHGDFKQQPNCHVNQKQGCPFCNLGFYTINRAERNKEDWLQIPTTLYFIKIKTEDEEFYKVGLTRKSIKERFKEDCFEIDILTICNTNLYNAVLMEAKILHKYKEHKYIPKTIFNGYTECFQNKN